MEQEREERCILSRKGRLCKDEREKHKSQHKDKQGFTATQTQGTYKKATARDEAGLQPSYQEPKCYPGKGLGLDQPAIIKQTSWIMKSVLSKDKSGKYLADSSG